MRVARWDNSGPNPVVVLDSAPRPQPGRGELLIRVCAAGVIPTEGLWYPTTHTKTGEKRTDAIPAHEFSGVVAEIGEDAGSFEIGREIFGMNDWFSDGAMAEYCIAPLSAIAPKPATLTHDEAASVPIGTLTAWQGLIDRAKVQAGNRVLIHGGAGGVGVFAVQLARWRDAHVIATASARDADFLVSLGAAEVIDYRASRFEDKVQKVDVVFDTVGGETLARSWSVLKPGGRMVTIASGAETTTDERVKQAFFIVEPNAKELIEIAALLDSGKIRAVVNAVVPLSRAPDAYAGKIEGQGRGKLVVDIAGETRTEKT